MTRDPITDPEILAETRARNRVAGGRDRELDAEPMSPWGSPAPVEQWPCRGKCGALVEVTAAVLDAWRTSNAMLAHAGEPPLGKGEVVCCVACHPRWLAAMASRDRKAQLELDQVVRELRTLAGPPGLFAARQAELVERLRKLHHPDVPGLLREIREQRNPTSNTNTNRKKPL